MEKEDKEKEQEKKEPEKEEENNLPPGKEEEKEEGKETPSAEKNEPEAEEKAEPPTKEKEPEVEKEEPLEPSVPPPPVAEPETTGAGDEVLELRAQIAAYKAGVKPEVVEDAVYLALRDAKKNGVAVDEMALSAALQGVLGRHPDWKAGNDPQGGFRVGADGRETPTAGSDIFREIFEI